MKSHREAVSEFSSKLFEIIGIPFDQTSELQRQLSAAFSFGMLFSYAKGHELGQSNTHALLISMLTDTFKYSSEQAGAFSQELIQVSVNPDLSSTMHAVIHRGIDGYTHFNAGQLNLVKDNLLGIFSAVQGAGA